jgi:hypothetical protein
MTTDSYIAIWSTLHHILYSFSAAIAALVHVVAMGSDDISAAAALSDSILPRLKSNLLAIGMWTDNTVRLIAIPTMDEIAT